jgi:hypothetical protein
MLIKVYIFIKIKYIDYYFYIDNKYFVYFDDY